MEEGEVEGDEDEEGEKEKEGVWKEREERES